MTAVRGRRKNRPGRGMGRPEGAVAGRVGRPSWDVALVSQRAGLRAGCQSRPMRAVTGRAVCGWPGGDHLSALATARGTRSRSKAPVPYAVGRAVEAVLPAGLGPAAPQPPAAPATRRAGVGEARRAVPPTRPSPQAARLTRRGSALAWLLAALVLVTAFLVGRGGGPASWTPADGAARSGADVAVDMRAAAAPVAAVGAAAPEAAADRFITVAPGQTLWEIAHAWRPGQDPRPVVAELIAANDLAGRPLQAGQSLRLPG